MGRKAGYSRKDYNYRMDPYIDGNTVRQPVHVEPVKPVPEEKLSPKVSRDARRNREKAIQVNLAYVVFLAAAAVVALGICIKFLQLQSASTAYRKTIAGLESQLASKRMDNDTEYKRAASSIDLNEVKDIAINELGMVYAKEGQVRTYNGQAGDYVKQYSEIPVE